MEIHKPKPWQSFREFLREYVIIVVGVLTALAAEQGAEWLHWRGRSQQAEVRMRADATIVMDAMLERLEIQSCQDRRLLLIRDRLLASGPEWTAMAPFYTKGPPAGSIYAHPMRDWPRTAWLNAVASTAANHLPDDQLAAYARIFGAAEREANDQTAEHETSSELNALGSNLPLTPDGKLSFLRTIEAERARNRVMAYEARNTLPYFKALGMAVEDARASARRNSLAYEVCAANGLL